MKLRKVSQLFDTLDPSPFRETDLALQAEDYTLIARWSFPTVSQLKSSSICRLTNCGKRIYPISQPRSDTTLAFEVRPSHVN
ncbi:hypothetical protein AB8A31_16335 [Tardiphaga sp. 804_B3_N1_9]|uniref:hypothetical protein n=1 Tax=Tardiphaga sp. 804_B3_N1_9 TaxID=3240786 RepID=UPI003F211AFD